MTQIDTEKRKLSARQIKAINSLLSAKDRSEAAEWGEGYIEGKFKEKDREYIKNN